MSKRRKVSRNIPERPRVQLPSKKLDIVIPVLGHFDFLERCLRQIPEAAGSVSYNVLVVDNGSPDKAKANEFYLGEFFKGVPNAQLRRLPQNVGFPRGCNLGAKMGRAEYVLFLNTDVFLNPGAIEVMVGNLDREANIGVVGPKLLFPVGSPQGPQDKIQHAGMAFNIRSEPIHQFIGWSADHPKVNRREPVQMVTGACLLTRRFLFERAGGFFEGYGVGTWEDVDYCLTMMELGYTILYEPGAVGYHWVGASAIENQIQYPLNDNRTIFMLRWNGNKALAWADWMRW